MSESDRAFTASALIIMESAPPRLPGRGDFAEGGVYSVIRRGCRIRQSFLLPDRNPKRSPGHNRSR